MSANYHFPHPSYDRPACPKCGAAMMLSRFDCEYAEDGKRTFGCVLCGHYETMILQYR
jgi:Zn ribbon nucleic-acid-binding protein